jgi:hypothetical protein
MVKEKGRKVNCGRMTNNLIGIRLNIKKRNRSDYLTLRGKRKSR